MLHRPVKLATQSRWGGWLLLQTLECQSCGSDQRRQANTNPEVARTMRCDGEPVRLGMRTTRRMSRASQPDKQNGTLSVHTIKASGYVHRTNRPNTRLHPTTAPEHQINPCNAGAIHTGHSQPQQSLRFSSAAALHAQVLFPNHILVADSAKFVTRIIVPG